MNNILGVIVLTKSDENFLPGNFVAAVGLRDCLRAYQRKIGARLRLGEVHGAGPLACGHVGNEFIFHLSRAVRIKRCNRAEGQQRAQLESHVGAAEHFRHGCGDDMRQALPAEFQRRFELAPAALDIFPIGVLKTFRRGDDVVGDLRALSVAAFIQRCQHFFGKFSSFVKNCADQIRRDFFTAWQLGYFIETNDMLQQKINVFDRCVVVGHAALHLRPRRNRQGSNL